MSEATQNLKMLEAAAVDPRVKMTAQMAIDEIERLQRRYASDSEHIEQLQTLLARTKDKIRELRAGYEAAKKNQRGAERAYEKAETEIERLQAALDDMKDVEAELRDDAQEWKTAYHNGLEKNYRLRAALWEIMDGDYHWLTTKVAKEALE